MAMDGSSLAGSSTRGRPGDSVTGGRPGNSATGDRLAADSARGRRGVSTTGGRLGVSATGDRLGNSDATGDRDSATDPAPAIGRAITYEKSSGLLFRDNVPSEVMISDGSTKKINTIRSK